MKTASQVLQEEHRLIVRATEALDRLVDYALDTDQLCIVSAIELLEFFEHFVDVAHQEKEERHLFPSLIASGHADDRVRELLREHRGERKALDRMRDDLEGAAFGSAPIFDRFLMGAATYASFLRHHARNEERHLLPLVEEFLDVEAQLTVLRGFAEVEERLLPAPREHYEELVASATQRLATTGTLTPAGAALG